MTDTPNRAAYVRDFPTLPADPADLDGWLTEVFTYVDNEALNAIAWYFESARRKKRGSWITRYLAVLCGGLAGLVPILGALWPDAYRLPLRPEQYALLTSLLLGVAALLVAFDRFGDFSSGWIRYIRTAFDIRAALQDFRLGWARYCSQLSRPVRSEDVPAALELATAFVLTVERFVGQETGEWAAEFQRNLTQMETDARARWEAREREIEAQAGASPRGTLQLFVANAAAVDRRTFTVRVRPVDGPGPEISETISGSRTWARGGLSPMTHIVTVGATIAGQKAEESRAVQIRANQVAELTVSLPE